MPVEPALVAYLDTQLAETAGTNLFEGPMPESPDACIAVTHYGGEGADGRVMGASLGVDGLVERVHVQLMVRGAVGDKAGPRTRANAAHAVLDAYSGTLSSVVYHRIESMDSEPYCLSQDMNGRWRYVCNYRVLKARG